MEPVGGMSRSPHRLLHMLLVWAILAVIAYALLPVERWWTDHESAHAKHSLMVGHCISDRLEDYAHISGTVAATDLPTLRTACENTTP